MLVQPRFLLLIYECLSCSQGPDSFFDAESPAALAELQAALSPFGINANAPAPEIEGIIDALSPEATLSL